MPSIYERALGADFRRLHPKIQERFGFSSRDGVAAIGRGVMEEIRRPPSLTWPFLMLGLQRHIMFPEHGRDVPFRIENYAYVDNFGFETVTWNRRFEFEQTRCFDAQMVYSEERGRIVDYLGTHQHLAVDLDVRVTADGGIGFRSGEQRFYEGFVGFRFPGAFTGFADVVERWDDEAGLYRIAVEVRNPVIGTIFGYRGRFECEWIDAPAELPVGVRPQREEARI